MEGEKFKPLLVFQRGLIDLKKLALLGVIWDAAGSRYCLCLDDY